MGDAVKLERDCLSIAWTPELEHKLKMILRTYRFEPHGETGSDHQLLQSLRAESVLLEQAFKDVRHTLATSQPDPLDLGILEAIDQLRLSHQQSTPRTND